MAGVCSGSGPCDVSPNDHGGKNWVSRAGGFPDWFHAIVNAMIRKGKSEGEAVALAWGIVRNWARGEGNVKPETRAKAAAMVARLDAMRGAAHLTAEATMPIDLAVPVAASNDGPQMTVSVGQHMAALRKLAAAHKRAGPTQRPKIRAKMAEHAQAIGAAKAKNLTADTAQPLDLAGAWDPSQHPRVAGKFAPKGTQTQGAAPKPASPALPPAMAAQIADFQRRNGLPVTGTFTPATVAAMQPKTGGGKGGKAGGAAKKAAKGGAGKKAAHAKSSTAKHVSAHATLKAAAAKKSQAGKATTAKTATMAAAAKSPAVRAYLKAGAAARAQQLASAKARTAQKAAVKASSVKATAAVAARLAHH